MSKESKLAVMNHILGKCKTPQKQALGRLEAIGSMGEEWRKAEKQLKAFLQFTVVRTTMKQTLEILISLVHSQ